MRLAIALLAAACCAAAAAAAAPAEPAPAPGLETLAAALADALGPPPDGRRGLALAVEVRARPLAPPLEAALAARLAARGYAVTPLATAPGAAEPEAAARAGGHDWLLRVQAGLVPGRRELAALGELVPAWPSFFLQRRPGARAVPPRLVQARAPADAATLLLAREGRPAGAPFAAVSRLARIPGRALALAVGEAEAGAGPAIVVVTPGAVSVLGPNGEPLAARALDPTGARPVRVPAAAVAVGDFGGGRIAVREAGAARGEVLLLAGGRLEPVAPLDAAPLCAGEAGALFGAFAEGTSLLEDRLAPLVDPAAPPRSGARLQAVACAPRGGPVAIGALRADLTLELLGPDRTPLVAPGGEPAVLPGVGTGFALGDLDGDGTAEVIASSPDPAPAGPDRIRVLAARPGAPPLVELGPIAGAILSGAAGDLTGDGVDDALLGAVVELDDGSAATDLHLVTSDPREAP